MPDIDLGVSYLEGWDDLSPIEDFASTVSEPRLRFHTEERERTVYAGLEWLLPTAVFVFIARSYFDSFLKEMGKDHYQFLKRGIKALGSRLLGPSGPKSSIVATQGKVSDGGKYSIVYSVLAQTRDLRTVKLLLRNGAMAQELSEAVDAFLDLCLQDDAALQAIIADYDLKGRGGHKVLLLTFNHETRTIEVVDPVPSKPKSKA